MAADSFEAEQLSHDGGETRRGRRRFRAVEPDMPDHRKHLHTLGLIAGATSEEIHQAFRDLVKVWHPDRFEDDPRLREKAQERLKEINQAYERLKDYRATKGTGTGE